MFKYWFGRTGEINQFGFLSKVVPGRGNSNVKVLQCLMCLMKSKEANTAEAEWQELGKRRSPGLNLSPRGHDWGPRFYLHKR